MIENKKTFGSKLFFPQIMSWTN